MLTFVITMLSPTEILHLYKAIKVPKLASRYIPPAALNELIDNAKSRGIYSVIGTSIQGREIGCIEIGTGAFKILAWSQMHGDESTATRALVDLFSTLTQEKHHQEFVTRILNYCTIRIVFQLNPDGAQAYQRVNADGYDLNRDALTQNQPESQLLTNLVAEFDPDLCLNCHDQRSLYSLSTAVNPPFISFLSPTIDEQSTLSRARKQAMKYISSAHSLLQSMGFDQVGRYDESYCAHCFGDYFQSKGIPTVLIESGFIIGDYEREESRYVVYVALLGILDCIASNKEGLSIVQHYFDIPENLNILRDIVLKNVLYNGKLVDIGLQNRWVLNHGSLKQETYVHDIANPGTIFGYVSKDLNEEEILINSHENDFENKIIASIMLKKSGLLIKIE